MGYAHPMEGWLDNLSPIEVHEKTYPVQVSEYAVLTQIQTEPAFVWWVHRVLRKQNRIVAKVKYKYWICTHKFGLKVPKSITEAIVIDCDNRDTF